MLHAARHNRLWNICRDFVIANAPIWILCKLVAEFGFWNRDSIGPPSPFTKSLERPKVLLRRRRPLPHRFRQFGSQRVIIGVTIRAIVERIQVGQPSGPLVMMYSH